MKVSIVGVGLIGGSIGLAARNEFVPEHVVGWDPNPRALSIALERGAIERKASSLADAVADAQVVFVATPVGELPAAIGAVLNAAPADCVVSDVGSTKRSVVAAHDDPRFVGGHPLAGAETAGVENARMDLFRDATWYLTPSQTATGTLFERLHRCVRGLGAQPTAIDAETHDAMLAAVSHLPHVFANVLVAQAASTLGHDGEHLPATGPSFRDATRVAGANSAIWTDIYLSNRDALLHQIDQAVERLSQIRDILAAADPQEVTRWNDEARKHRRRLLEVQPTGEQLFQLRAAVPNEPGVVARIALELGKAGVNISDLGLYPAPDHSEGVASFWIAGDKAARRAEHAIAALGYHVEWHDE